jgi:hypothetical protein
MSQDFDEINPAPEVSYIPRWSFTLSKKDALLVLKALGGRLTDVEVKEAKELGDRLTELRQATGQDYQNSLDRAARAAAEGFTGKRNVAPKS